MIFANTHSHKAAVRANPVINGVRDAFAEKGLKNGLEFGGSKVTLKVEWDFHGETRQAYIDFHNDGKVTSPTLSLQAQPVFPAPPPSRDPAVQLANEIAIEQITIRGIPEAWQAASRTALRAQLGGLAQIGFQPATPGITA